MTHSTITQVLEPVIKVAKVAVNELQTLEEKLDRVDTGYKEQCHLLLLELIDTQSRNIKHHPDISAGLVVHADFATALRWAKLGFRISRHGWNGNGMWVFAEGLDTDTPYMTLHNSRGQDQKGWVASQGDMFATDWLVLYELDVEAS